ncbi:MAG: hypothetical protein O8C61_07855 [Candidatus Methanoperedens sp.]|nr:hypothetical protein [Candidatus Methanoperedens sp.]
MVEKFTGKEKKGEHEAAILNKEETVIFSYKGSEPPIEPPITKKGKK